jgi:4-diphosphocytidyl-2-C-methyl-D-erythritol kinase
MKNSLLVTRYSPLSLRAPAKINWFLSVLEKRKDGYHNIQTMMQCVSLFDNLIFESSETIEVMGDLDIPVQDNLAYKAASLLKQYTSCKGGARIRLQKEIPISAGLGGGSSDAASVLLGLNILWRLKLRTDELSSIGMEIGSDVPFFVNGLSAFVEGKGEKITPLQMNNPFVILLVKLDIAVSSAWAYTSLDTLRMHRIKNSKLTKKPVDIKLFCQALNKQDFASLNTILHNDLERVVFERYPVVGEIKDKMVQEGAIISAMSGSGPAVFGVFRSKDTAEKAAEAIKSSVDGGWCRVVESLV